MEPLEVAMDDITFLLRVAVFAADRHRDQRRKDVGASPYINHPLEVAELLARCGVSDRELLAAALLHDTVEDTQTAPRDIEREFGPTVRHLVDEVTDDKSLQKTERKRLQVTKSHGKSNRAKQLKIADKICNIRDIDADSPAGWNLKRKVEYLEWAEQVVAGCRGINRQLDDLFDSAVEDARDRLNG